MKNRLLVRASRALALFGTSVALLLLSLVHVQAQTLTCTQRVEDYATCTVCIGTYPNGRPYGLQVPDDWNGTLFLKSPGYVAPGTPAPTAKVPSLDLDPFWWIVEPDPSDEWLLANGHAIATSWSGLGWTVRANLLSQIRTLDTFATLFGAPSRTIATGGSLGGLITAGLIQQNPQRFDGGVSFNGALAGSIGSWNQILDFGFALKEVLAPESGIQLVRITDPAGNLAQVEQLLDQAQGTPEGRARIALACAVADLPTWYDPASPEPVATDYAARQQAQFLWARDVIVRWTFGVNRADLEMRARGNFSWNTNVNYEAQLERSSSMDLVVALYAAAGLSLAEDLERLKVAPRIVADPAAVDFVTGGIVYNGKLGGVPILTVHTVGDGLALVEQEFAYRSAVLTAQDSRLLRQAFINRAGHGPFTTAEVIAAYQTMLRRLDTGKWEDSASPEALNATALALGPDYNNFTLPDGTRIPWPPGFAAYDPERFLRPYDLAVAPEPGPPSIPFDETATTPGEEPALRAWPLPYQSGSLQIAFAAGVREVGIYDLSGRRVRLLTRTDGASGQTLEWDGRNANGAAVGDGIYFLRATGAGPTAQMKLVVIR